MHRAHYIILGSFSLLFFYRLQIAPVSLKRAGRMALAQTWGPLPASGSSLPWKNYSGPRVSESSILSPKPPIKPSRSITHKLPPPAQILCRKRDEISPQMASASSSLQRTHGNFRNRSLPLQISVGGAWKQPRRLPSFSRSNESCSFSLDPRPQTPAQLDPPEPSQDNVIRLVSTRPRLIPCILRH